MIELKTAIVVSVIHLLYYAYFQLISDLIRIGMVRNNPNPDVSKLRTKYKVNIRTFQKNSNHFGFAWFKTIYLNENLFRRKKALYWTFFHEYYHLQHKHKRNVLAQRFLFSLVPLLLAVFHWTVFAAVYVFFAWGMEYLHKRYEVNANNYAIEMIKNEKEFNQTKGKKSST